MQEHAWIVAVCEDLGKYAQVNGLINVASAMKDTVAAAKLEANMLANTDAGKTKSPLSNQRANSATNRCR